MFHNGNEKWKQPYFRSFVLCLCLFVLAFAGFAAYVYTQTKNCRLVLIAAAVILGALVLFGLCLLLRRTFYYRITHTPQDTEPILRSLTLDLIQRMYLPVLICDDKSKILWYNKALAKLYHSAETLHGRFLDQFTSVDIQSVIECEEEQGLRATLKRNVRPEYAESVFAIRAFRLSFPKKNYYITVWNDKSDLVRKEKEMADQDDVVAFIVIDNLQEMLQFEKEKYRIAAARAESTLRRFAQQVQGILKEYENDKFIMVFKACYLPQMLQKRFPIMDEIREIRADENMPVTLSIGVSDISGTLAQKEEAARSALETALQRGGDQAVYKTRDNVEYYGGRTKTLQKRTKVRSRVIATELVALIAKSENVLIMGHAHADHDALGSCVGLAALCRYCGVDAKIAMENDNENISACLDCIEQDEVFSNVFVECEEILDFVRPNTLLLISDVCNPRTFSVPELYENVRRCVIIDHHRLASELPYPPLISYIEPAASSASELVAEILEQVMPTGEISKECADLMLAGMLLDTDQFTRNTGVRTFSAALYLRGEGADPADAKRLFRSSLDDFMREAKFQSNVVIYRSVIAITYRDSDGTGYADCIAAAKAANKLLMLDGVAASFALVRVGEKVHISARSQGEINVQLILEKLNGGGHFDAAAAQISGVSMAKTMEMLRDAIDAYLDA